MALVMAENEQPVFRDFLGLDRGVTSKQQQQQQQQQQAEECYTSATTTTTSDVVLRATSRSSVGFDSEGDVGTTRGSSETGGRFETSSAPGYVTPPFGLALPSSSDPGSGDDPFCCCSLASACSLSLALCLCVCRSILIGL